MSKDETQQLKGIAIMMMLWLHLFGTSREILDHCQTFIYLWNGDPLIYAMRKLGRMCIVFYTFLGGYGLYKVYVNSIISAAGRQVASTHGPRRALRLLKHYWIVLALFLIVAIPLFPKTYPGGWMALILNITSIDCTYNDALWFLFPYIMLTLASTPIMRCIHNTGGWRLAALAAVIFGVRLMTYTTDLGHHGWVVNLVATPLLNTLSLLFMFVVGAIFAKYDWMTSMSTFIRRRLHTATSHKSAGSIVAFILLVALAFLRVCVGASTLFDPPFLVIMIALYLSIDRPQWVNRSLSYLGHHSTNLWFTHRYVMVLAGVLVALPRFPILIFASLIIVCLVISYIIDGIQSALQAPLLHHPHKR